MKVIVKQALDAIGVREALWDSWFHKLLKRDGVTRKRDRAVSEFYLRFAQENRLTDELWYDVGANVGGKAAIFRKMCRRLVAVEPDPQNFSTLERRMRFCSNVELVEAAVGSRSGSMQLVCAGAYSTLSTKEASLLRREKGFMGGKVGADNSSVAIRVTTLDQLFKRYGTPAFIKIDVEGFEVEVFAGLSQPVRTVCFEANLPEFEEETLRCIRRYASLTRAEFNYTTEEPPTAFASTKWLSEDDLRSLVKAQHFGYAEIYGRAL